MFNRVSQCVFLMGTFFIFSLGCGDYSASIADGPRGPGGNTNVNLGGAQDFGYFRRLIDNDIVPPVEAVDVAGFFAEHHTPLPEPTCGERMCVQAMLGVMGNLLTGQNCTLLQVGLNSPLEADPEDRPPLSLAVVVDVSGSMESDGKMDFVRQGLERMVNELSDDDRMAIVTYSSEADVVFSMNEVRGERNTLVNIIRNLEADGSTNLCAGLEAGYRAMADELVLERQTRVILLSDGVPTAGEENTETILQNSRAYNSEGIGLTTIGLGTDFNLPFMRGLSEQGDGNFYFVEDVAAVDEVFTEELAYFTVPVALDLHLELAAGEHYEFGRAYGSSLFETNDRGGTLDIPSVFLAHRQAHDDMAPGGGRRGGGSALLVELMPREDDGSAPVAAEVAKVSVTFRDPTTDTEVTDEVVAMFPGAPWDMPEKGYFENEIVTKSFVMLNVAVAFENAVELFHTGDGDRAVGLLDRVIAAVVDYNEEIGDADMDADIDLMFQLRDVMRRQGAGSEASPAIPEDPWPAD